ncbi:Dbl homology domain-containing protein [Rozella allomycis CSF55]|uniref:Dbl homology domain-containing protein n=1 Tax=Rozella allomycis (strain CSF55) TaxID=988480 RepID=A0A4P9YNR5_ROZAC|nr:Dbl homology domain-containing protein [Rozella allomycis CSF55]
MKGLVTSEVEEKYYDSENAKNISKNDSMNSTYSNESLSEKCKRFAPITESIDVNVIPLCRNHTMSMSSVISTEKTESISEESIGGSPETLRNMKWSLERMGLIDTVDNTPVLYTRESSGFKIEEIEETVILKRHHVIKEIISTEETEIKQVFSNFSSILKLHKEHFLPKLMHDPLTEEKMLGRCFQQFSNYTSLYLSYINNFETAVDVWRQCLKRKNVFDFAEERKRHLKHSQVDLISYLMMPFQRIPRYCLLLQSLISCTNVDHEDYQNLTQALKELLKRTNEINDKKREYENASRLYEIALKLKQEEQIIKPYRKLLMESALCLKYYTRNDSNVILQCRGTRDNLKAGKEWKLQKPFAASKEKENGKNKVI